MPEYTTEEQLQLGKLFPDGLFQKLVTTIRDAIIGAPKFDEKVRAIVSEQNPPTRAEFEVLKKRVETMEASAKTEPKVESNPPAQPKEIPSFAK